MGGASARQPVPQYGEIAWLGVPGNFDAVADDEQFLMNATKDTWRREYEALAGDGKQNPGEIALCEQMQAERIQNPVVRAYYDQVKTRLDIVVRVGKARNWL